MIQVLHIITGLLSGGAERMLTRLVTAPGNERIRHHVVSMLDLGFYGADLQRHHVPVYCLNMKRGLPSLPALLGLRRLIRDLKPEIIQTWLYHADLLGLMAARFALSPAALCWNIRNSELDVSRHGLALAAIIKLLALLSPLPNAIVVNSEAGLRAHQDLGYRPRRWVLLPNGFEPQEAIDTHRRNTLRAQLGIEGDALLFGHVARFDPQKDHATLLRAARLAVTQMPHAQFVLIGSDVTPENPALRVLLPQDETRRRFHLLGERTDVTALMQTMDALVLSSAYGEGFPNVIGEAMTAGVPCITTSVGDALDIVGDTGIIVPPRDFHALSAAMAQFGAMPPDVRRELGGRAKTRISKLASLPDIIAKYEAFYESLLRSPRP